MNAFKLNVIHNLIIFALVFFAWTTLEVFSARSIAAKPKAKAQNTQASTKKSSSKKAAKPAGKERNIVREKIYKGDSRKIDFEAVDIGGERKTPFGSLINQNKANKEFDLIKIRLRWHPEMIQSTSSLETGRTGS